MNGVDDRPIGVMDSGLGGIGVLAEIVRLLPRENYLFYGDTLHIPYGDKPPETVLRLTRDVVEELIARGSKAIVIACNTATSAAADALRGELPLPIIGMEPALKPASTLPGDGRVLVMATRVTLALPKFHALMERYGKDAVPVPCPGLMECVEAGELRGERVRRVLEALLTPYLAQPVKAVVLGCTHYVLLRDEIARFFPPGTPLVDGNEGAARQLKRRLDEGELLSQTGRGEITLLSSQKDEATLRRMQAMLRLCTGELSPSTQKN